MIRRLIQALFCLAIALFLHSDAAAQTSGNDSLKFNYSKIYSLCLDADIKPALELIKIDPSKKISPKDSIFRERFESRFNYPSDNSGYLTEFSSPIDSLLAIFHSYWRTSLLDTSHHYENILVSNLNSFFSDMNLLQKGTVVPEDSLGKYIKIYIKGKGFFTNGFGKVGRLYDLHVWKNQKDTTYNFSLHGEKTSSRIVMMEDFITLGWEEYATLGKYYPGGWTTPQSLYCVQKAYDIKSENFLISYLAHESRHFADMKLFPNISGVNLEYRAKLTELSLAKKTLFKLIMFFINNANENSVNEHSAADYRVISDLSKVLFKEEFERDISKWEHISVKKINKKAYSILKANTRMLENK
ncbi:MAG: hypothetical protein ABI091_29435 [Ferruginibacter sp.]